MFFIWPRYPPDGGYAAAFGYPPSGGYAKPP